MLREEATDADLVTLALERYETPLVRYAISILGDIERAREVVQDTFLKLCREKNGRARNHLVQWLFTVCRNRAFDVRRKDSRMRSLRAADFATGPASGPRPLGAFKAVGAGRKAPRSARGDRHARREGTRNSRAQVPLRPQLQGDQRGHSSLGQLRRCAHPQRREADPQAPRTGAVRRTVPG